MIVLPVLLLIGSLFCQAQDQAPPRQTREDSAASLDSGKSSFSERNARYRLRAGDGFEINFEFSPEFNQTVSVQPDGFVTLRGIGDVHVDGQTIPELTSTIKTAYSKILHDPAVAIVLKDFEKPFFIAAGELVHPGRYDMRGEVTVMEALAIAGGFNDSAKHSEVVLYRRVSGNWMEGKLIDVKKMWKARNINEDLYINPGDMIFVPRSGFSKWRRFIPVPSMGMGTVW